MAVEALLFTYIFVAQFEYDTLAVHSSSFRAPASRTYFSTAAAWHPEIFRVLRQDSPIGHPITAVKDSLRAWLLGQVGIANLIFFGIKFLKFGGLEGTR